MAASKWRSIADDLSKKIENGEIARGAQLPTEQELQEEYDASRNTIRDAIRWLIQRRMVETHPGRGTFVSAKITPFAVALSPRKSLISGETAAYVVNAQIQGRKPSMSSPRVEIRMATKVMARQLQIAEGARVVSRHQQRFIDDQPWSLQTSFYPMDFVERGAERLVDAAPVKGGVVKYLKDALGLEQAGYQDLITVRPPSRDEARFFELVDHANVTLIELGRTGYASTGEPMRFTQTVYPADRNTLYYNIGEVPESVADVMASP